MHEKKRRQVGAMQSIARDFVAEGRHIANWSNFCVVLRRDTMPQTLCQHSPMDPA